MFAKERADSRSGSDAFEGSSGRIAWDIQLETVVQHSDGVATGTTTFTSALGGFTGKAGYILSIVGVGNYDIAAVGSDTSVTLDGAPASATGLTFKVIESERVAYDWLLANAPAEYVASSGTSYKPQTINVTPSEVGDGILLGEVIYAQVKPLQFSFQTGGGSEKIEYSLATQHKYDAVGKDAGPPASDAPIFNGAINVTKDSIEGVSIKAAQFQFKITKSWGPGTHVDSYGTFAARSTHDSAPAGYLYLSTDGDGHTPAVDGSTPAFPILYVMGSGGSGDWSEAAHVSGEIDGQYMRDLRRMTPSYNNAPFTILIGGIWMHFLTGELLFEGTDGGMMVNERFELTYAFAASDNIEPTDDDSWRSIGDILIDEKRGWDLIWVFSEQKPDTTTQTITRTPRAAYVEKVYKSTDFSKLRLEE
jgi:hypothetical protein